jgi:hypothetical protein
VHGERVNGSRFGGIPEIRRAGFRLRAPKPLTVSRKSFTVPV